MPDRDTHHRDEVRRIGRSAAVVSTATLASRVLGLVRDAVIYRFFTVMQTDSFFLAFLIPNSLRRLVAEGSLTVAFVPLFSEALTGGSPEEGRREARHFANVAFTFMTIFLIVLSAAGVLAAPWIVGLLTPGQGFADVPGKTELTVRLTRVMFPYLFFISLVALAMGVLNAQRRFFAPAISPLLLNVAMIAFTVALRHRYDPPIRALAWGVIAGGIVQLAFQLPAMARTGFLPRPDFGFGHPRLKRLLWLMFPAAFGVAVYQAYIFVLRYYASFLPEGTISYHFAADRLIEFPLALIPVALGTAMLPSLSDQAARRDAQALNRTYSEVFSLMLFLMLPAAAGLIALRVPILNVLLQRGPQVDAAYIAQIGRALAFMAIGMWSIGTIRITAPLFYAMRDTRTPVLVSCVSLLANIGLCHLFVRVLHLDQGWLAFVSGLTGMGHTAFLWVLLRIRLPGFRPAGLGEGLWKILAASILMGLAVHALASLGDWTGPSELGGGLIRKAGRLGGIVAAGAVVYTAATRALGCRQWDPIAGMLRRKFRQST